VDAGGQLGWELRYEIESTDQMGYCTKKQQQQKKKQTLWWPKYVIALLSEWNNIQTKGDIVTLVTSCCNIKLMINMG